MYVKSLTIHCKIFALNDWSLKKINTHILNIKGFKEKLFPKFHLASFSSAWRISFSFSYCESRLEIDYFNVFLSGKIIMLPSFLKDVFAAYRNLCWQVFPPLSTLKISFHCCIDAFCCIASDENSEIIFYLCSPIYIKHLTHS